MSYSITQVSTTSDLKDTIELFQEYAASLNIDLSFQDFDSEVAKMPGIYSPPRGVLLLARSEDGQAIGCVEIRCLDEFGSCEMKRLYVSPRGRGMGLGSALALQAIEQARRLNYHRVRLDKLQSMTSAKKLYQKLGFVEIEPYYHNPLADVLFLELDLINKVEGEFGI
jgi:ribosomal protein S18 acetylase RimI-like enzyme